MNLVDIFLGRTYIEYLEASSINEAEKVQQVVHKQSWMDPFIKYLIEGILSDDP